MANFMVIQSPYVRTFNHRHLQWTKYTYEMRPCRIGRNPLDRLDDL